MFKSFTLKTKPLMPNRVIMKNGGNILTTGNFIQLTGQAKTCKTSVLGEILTSLLDGKNRLGFEFEKCPIDKQVVFINTELSAYDFWEFCKKIVETVGEENAKNFKGFDGQSFTPDLMKKSLTEYLTSGNPYVIVIDGIVDFVSDPNNQNESKQLVDSLLAKCKQHECSMIVTLHQNPGSFTSKSRGHLGTHIEQKASGTLSTQRLKNYFKLRGDKMRSTEPFEYAFQWSNKGLVKYETQTEDFSEQNILLSLVTKDILKSDLVKAYMTKSKRSKNFAYQLIKEALESGLIIETVVSSRKSLINLI